MTEWPDRLAGFKWPVAATQPIAASSDLVWKTISEPGNLESSHPFCRSNPVLQWPGVGSRDEVHYLNGRVLERQFTKWFEGVGYDLEIGRANDSTSHVSWRIEPIGDTACTLTITVYPNLLEDVPVSIRWIPHLVKVRPKLKSYLSSVTRGFEWHITRGEKVPTNQFGSHSWFS